MKPHRILIVEDSRTQAEEIRLLLTGAGFVGEIAHDAESGLARLTASPFDLLLTDIVMPGMSGYELCRKVKALSAAMTVPVILLTKLRSAADILQGLECSADNFIPKPYQPDVLIERITSILANKALRAGNPAEVGVKVAVMGQPVTITSQREQLLDLLISTFEELLSKNAALEQGGRLYEESQRHAIELHREMAARKRLEEQYQQAQQRLEHVISSSPAVLFTLSLQSDRILGKSWISDNLRDILGYSPEEAYSSDWWQENVVPADRDRVSEETHKGLFTQGHVAHEYRFRHRDGNYRWTRSEIRIVCDTAGRPVEAVGSWSDVTERKNLEDLLRQAQKMEAIGRLAGGVAHDFNNLLTVITGYGEVVLNSLPGDAPARGLVEEILAAGARAAGLTRQLLAFSRKAIIEPKVLDLKAVVVDLDKLLRRIIGEDVQMKIIADPLAGTVKMDLGQIEQVLMNLVVNARDAMPRGGKLIIEVRNADLDATYTQLRPDARPGRYVLLAVSDTGCGMDAATMTRIFEPFFTTKGDKGTGLGLATVHGIVKQAGGHVSVYSEVGVGTTFKIYLPRLEQRLTPSKSHHGQMTMTRGQETVLLVEDEDSVRALTRHVLISCGYTVLAARDGAEAMHIAAVHTGEIDLLVTDVVMPGLGGREVAERLREKRAGIKVLYCSGYTDDAVVQHGILEAQVAFLQKPFTPVSLAAKVREVLDS